MATQTALPLVVRLTTRHWRAALPTESKSPTWSRGPTTIGTAGGMPVLPSVLLSVLSECTVGARDRRFKSSQVKSLDLIADKGFHVNGNLAR
jgi:hypothetical protein